MFTASNTLVRAKKYFIPKGRKSKRKKILVCGKGRNKYRYFYGDKDYYRSYYLNSLHWKKLRNIKLDFISCCEICGSKQNIEIHHLDYKHLYDVQLSDLKVLCRKCHVMQHKF